MDKLPEKVKETCKEALHLEEIMKRLKQAANDADAAYSKFLDNAKAKTNSLNAALTNTANAAKNAVSSLGSGLSSGMSSAEKAVNTLTTKLKEIPKLFSAVGSNMAERNIKNSVGKECALLPEA
ncbi:MAG: hypothetical protein HFE73_05185 [Firmicutes bacterium]|jgi:hypothetical protein|nr:hypothetical protein [Bacillota bacterium]